MTLLKEHRMFKRVLLPLFWSMKKLFFGMSPPFALRCKSFPTFSRSAPDKKKAHSSFVFKLLQAILESFGLAEGEGFEPPDASRRQRFSRPVPGVRNTGTYHLSIVKSFTIRNIEKLIFIKESPSQWSKIGAKKDDLFLRFFEKNISASHGLSLRLSAFCLKKLLSA